MSQPSAAGSPDTPIDATVRLMTPERIVFEYPLGGPFRRFTASMVDLSLLALLVVGAVAVSLLLSLGAASGMGPALVTYFLLSWGYGAFCEGVFNGQTPGKRALGLRVVSERGVPITGVQAVLRNLVGAVDGLVPFFFMLGLLSMLLSGKFQRLGDLAAGTMVIIEQRQPRLGAPDAPLRPGTPAGSGRLRGLVPDLRPGGRCPARVRTAGGRRQGPRVDRSHVLPSDREPEQGGGGTR